MNYLGRYSIGALEVLNDEYYQLGALGYLMGEVEGRTAIDMWTAVRQSSVFLNDPPRGDLHLFGFSAGALSALWAQRLYEANGWNAC